MSSVLNTTSTMEPHSLLPDGVSRGQGVVMLQDNDFFLSCDPHLNKYEAKGEVAEPQIPEGVDARGPTLSFEVTDELEIPKGIWGSTVVSTYEFTNIEYGVWNSRASKAPWVWSSTLVGKSRRPRVGSWTWSRLRRSVAQSL